MIAELHHMHWRDLAEHVRRTVGQVDALIVDAPYSERTHSGHDDGTAQANRFASWAESVSAGRVTPERADRIRYAAKHGTVRRELSYPAWDEADVSAFVEAWGPLCGGWFVSLTDHILAPRWESALERAGFYTFAPFPSVEPGSRVRMTGDGPSNWSVQTVVARPRSAEWLDRWRCRRRARSKPCALPGAYVLGEGESSPREGRSVAGHRVVGGKALALMERIVDDYSEPGDLVCDPCMGAGTTLLAAKLLGRRYIGGDLDETHVEIARERLRDLPAQPKKGTLALPWEDR